MSYVNAGSSSFGGLNRALSALQAQQRGLDVTSQNIANMNTDGYSRQRAELQSIGGSTVPAIFSTSPIVGQGVSADSVTRIRDTFLEGRAQLEHAGAARLTAQSASLSDVETAFREPGDTGIQKLMADLWSGFATVANTTQSTDVASRGALLEKAQTLVGGIRTTRASLDTQWSSTRSNLTTLVAQANTTARGIADLNLAIQRATAGGKDANELADRRDVLVQQLATAIGATSSRADDGTLNVSVGGTMIVSQGSALTLSVSGPTNPDAVAAAGAGPSIVVTPGNVAISVDGTAGGMLGALGPAAAQGTSILTFRTQLDDFASSLASTVNGQQTAGFDLDGNPGVALFGAGGGTTISAATITLAMTDPRGVAAARYGKDANGNPSADQQNAALMSKLGIPPSGPDATYRSLVTNLGVQSAVATRNVDIQSVIAGQVDASRESVAGVNQDEELSNMLQFQHAYSAASRMVTAIDEMLDTLINKTGLVGR